MISLKYDFHLCPVCKNRKKLYQLDNLPVTHHKAKSILIYHVYMTEIRIHVYVFSTYLGFDQCIPQQGLNVVICSSYYNGHFLVI